MRLLRNALVVDPASGVEGPRDILIDTDSGRIAKVEAGLPAEGHDVIDLEGRVARLIAGLEKKNRLINDQEKTIVAYHESGHAIVAERLEHADPVHKISIIPRGIGALGYTQQLPTEDRYLLTRLELLDRIAVLLGGRVAEEIVFDEISTGAQNDLARVTEIARSMVME